MAQTGPKSGPLAPVIHGQQPYTDLVKPSVGSLFAILLGSYLLFTGFSGYPFEMDSLVGGITIILGALAYRSAKQRQLGLRPSSKIRRGGEIALVALVTLPLVILLAEGRDAIWFYPWSGIVAPVGTLLAFLWVLIRKNHDNLSLID